LNSVSNASKTSRLFCAALVFIEALCHESFALRSDRGSLNRVRGGTNHVDHEAGVREHGDVAAVDLVDRSAHPLRHEALQLGLDGVVVLATMYQLGFDFQAVPSTFWLNRSAAGAAWVAQDDLLLRLGQVSREARDAFREHPDSPVGNVDVGEDVGDGELVLLALRRLAVVRGECGDIDQSGNALNRSRGRDDRSTVRVADEYGRRADPP